MKPKPSSKALSKPPKTIAVVMLIDSWFPTTTHRVGTFGGGQVHVRELRRHLQDDFHCKVQLFFSNHPNLLIRLIWAFMVPFRIMRYGRTHKIDLIHTHGFITGLAGKITALLIKKPQVHTVHGSHLMDQRKNTPKTWLETWLLTQIKYDAEITVGSNFKKYSNVNTNVVTIPNGVDLAAFNAVKVKKNIDPTLIWVGRRHPHKGLPILKEAIRKVRRKIPRLKTELVTGGRLSGKALITAYKKAHVFVLPSLAEGQPITLLEAWAAKLPVIVTKVGENPNMVVDGVSGYLIDPGNVQQLSQAILKVLNSRNYKQVMGMAGYDRVKRNHTWKNIAGQTYALYQSLLK